MKFILRVPGGLIRHPILFLIQYLCIRQHSLFYFHLTNSLCSPPKLVNVFYKCLPKPWFLKIFDNYLMFYKEEKVLYKQDLLQKQWKNQNLTLFKQKHKRFKLNIIDQIQVKGTVGNHACLSLKLQQQSHIY